MHLNILCYLIKVLRKKNIFYMTYVKKINKCLVIFFWNIRIYFFAQPTENKKKFATLCVQA
jgi:hypothetical protein